MKKININCFALIFIFMISISEAYNFHGAAMAPNTLLGWVVTIDDIPLVLHTPDCGLTWINQSFISPLSHFDVFSLNEQKVWICGYAGFIYYTPNGGQNWYQQVQGLSKWAARVFFINDTCGWAACGAAIVGRTISGNDTIYQDTIETWQQVNLTNPPFSADSCDIYGIHFIDQNRGWFCAGRYPEYVPVADETLYTGGQGYIAKTSDGGGNPLTWQLLRRDTIYDFFDIKFIDSLTGFVVGGNDRNNAGVVMKTTDGGQNWQTVTIPTQAKVLRALEIVGNRHAWAVGRNGTIIRSTDGGSNWILQQNNVDTTLFDVDFADTLRGLISGNGYVLYTANGGLNWSIADLPGIEEINLNIKLQTSKSIIHVFPNPFRYQTTFIIQDLTTKEHNLQIYDISGKLVKSFNIFRSSVIWEGKDNYGRFVPAGVYFATMKNSNNLTVAPIVYQK